MPAKKKTENTSEATAIKAPRKRATKKTIESETIAADNDNVIVANAVVEVVEVNESLETKEISKVNEVKEVNETTNGKSVEVAEIHTSANTEITQSISSETIETTTDNNQTNASNIDNAQEATSNKKEKREGIYVQRKFYERVIGEKLEVTIQLEKLKITGIITYEHPFYILVETKQGQQFIYKGSISYISAKKPFIKRPFIKRDRPFNNTENNDNQAATGQEDSANRPRFTRTPRENQNPNITQTETNQSQQASEQPIRKPNEARPLNRYQNQPPKTQSKPEPQKDAREVKVYKIVCAPPVKPKK
jgi:sRNA-binding regulator protein Hfq